MAVLSEALSSSFIMCQTDLRLLLGNTVRKLLSKDLGFGAGGIRATAAVEEVIEEGLLELPPVLHGDLGIGGSHASTELSDHHQKVISPHK